LHRQPHRTPICRAQVAGIVNKELFTGVALEARFSTHGARQLQTDVEALCSVFRPYTARPAAVFKELLEACVLLRLDAATADSLASMLDSPVDFGALVFDGWSAARTPPVARRHGFASLQQRSDRCDCARDMPSYWMTRGGYGAALVDSPEHDAVQRSEVAALLEKYGVRRVSPSDAARLLSQRR